MSENLARRRFLIGGACSVSLLPLAGNSAESAVKSESKAKPHYGMVYDQTKCVGCLECIGACNKSNNLPAGQARLTIETQECETEGEYKYVRVSCQQCQDAPCVNVCPTGAACRDEATGIVTMDSDKCAGCKYCIGACPYNVRIINEETKVAENCDFCLNSHLSKGELPGCVQACRFDALVFGDLNDPDDYINKLLAVTDTVRVKPFLGTSPSLRYIPITKAGSI